MIIHDIAEDSLSGRVSVFRGGMAHTSDNPLRRPPTAAHGFPNIFGIEPKPRAVWWFWSKPTYGARVSGPC